MNSSSLKKIFLFLFLIGTLNSFGQAIILSKDARTSVITCDTGNESYSLFGHTAIRITDSENNLDVVYNYGAFDFRTPNFVAKFAKGDLQYFAVANTFSDFMSQYTYEQRSVFEQELILPLAYKQKLFDNLTAVLASRESYYTYKFIDKNCTSMVVDILNRTLGAQIITKKLDTDKTYRSILFPYFDNFFYEKLGTSIIFGTKVDQYSNHIFLPFELHKSLEQTQFNNNLLCKKSKILLEFKKQAPSSWWNNIYTYLVFLGLILVLNKKYIDIFYLLVMGLLGIFFATVGFYSYHQELANNYNVLLFNPTLLVLLYFLLVKNKKWIIYVAVFNMVLIGVYLIVMINKAHLLIALPLVLTSAFILAKITFKNSKRIPIVI
ncbi:lipoprotein N-acyltransferase Lnb domain-containing protein [Flavobacterium franklandianum]|uniref:DUF4105 domain-containing protein n=1 Tax=Flavobacterium franklandianum TaxID=2594430 RepID=A0A553CJY5_9FLAO|nr:DUF4105 domain-containing protein [Flavobacterium franklandianum]TRX20809.1 DUF4105 domain-containing protein [Flavobacterium franklandianum]